MRVDKYLWSVRYYKTRSLATKACKKGLIKINGDTVKPSREVYLQDKIEVRKNQTNYLLKVNDIPKSRVGAKLVDIYRMDITPKTEFEAQEMLKFAHNSIRERGTGRPTKKERRDLDEFKDEEE